MNDIKLSRPWPVGDLWGVLWWRWLRFQFRHWTSRCNYCHKWANPKRDHAYCWSHTCNEENWFKREIVDKKLEITCLTCMNDRVG